MNKRCAIVSLLFYLIIFVGCSVDLEVFPNQIIAQNEDTIVKESVWLYTLCSEDFAGRKAGTEGNYKAFKYIFSELSKMKFPVDSQCFMINDVRFRNIIVDVPGVCDTVIVIGAHYDGANESTYTAHYPAANDNASGVVALLNIALDCSSGMVDNHYSLKLCFWDGEENNYGTPFKGSSYFAEHMGPECMFYVNIDTIGHKHDGNVKLYYSFLTGEKAKSYLEDRYSSDVVFAPIIHNAATSGSSDYVSFGKKSIPYIGFANEIAYPCGHNIHSTLDTPDVISLDHVNGIVHLIENMVSNIVI